LQLLDTPRALQIVDQLLSHPVVQIAPLAKDLDVAYGTARSDVKKLCDKVILVLDENQSPKTYIAQEIAHIAFAKPAIPLNPHSETG